MKTKSLGFGEAVKELAAEAGMPQYKFSQWTLKKKKDLILIKIFLKNIQIFFISNFLNLKIVKLIILRKKRIKSKYN